MTCPRGLGDLYPGSNGAACKFGKNMLGETTKMSTQVTKLNDKPDRKISV